MSATTAGGAGQALIGTGTDEVAAFARDGVLNWGPFLRPEELDPVRAAMERAFYAGAEGEAVAADVRDLSERRGKPLEYGLLQKVDLWQTEPVFAALVARPDVVARVEALLGGPVRLFRDHAFYKPAGKGEASNLVLHQDNRYWHLDPPTAATIWVALDDATVANGCVHYVLGSHTRGRIGHERTDPDSVLVEAVTDEEAVPYPVPAGSALIHHAQTLHGSPPNTTPWPRRAYCVVYMRADILRRGEPVTDYPLATELAAN
ncbi:MAG TPA: phytanoyl-CoA dioxygenase family protein [Mycobacteriales bacterium]|nr:phytanoyl-CoA dioxygenase family protein [Mycobacteriales bacterium]